MSRIAVLLSILLALSACSTATFNQSVEPSNGSSAPRAYRIPANGEAQIQFRMMDAVNSLRQARGLQPVRLEPRLNAAAATHSRDMSVQNRPWHFGSDGSSPVDRLRRVRYTGQLVGETISETFETELETLAAWMENPTTRSVIMDPRATEMGFAYFQEDNYKIWWTLVMATQTGRPTPALSANAG